MRNQVINLRVPGILAAGMLVFLAVACGRSSENSRHQLPDRAALGDNVAYEVLFDGL